jgi:HEAT repeat protein
MPETTYFEDVLMVLFDPEQPLEPARLAELSDLDRTHASLFKRAWLNCPPARRKEIITRLGVLAEDQLEFLFDRVNRLVLDDPEPAVRRQAIANLWEVDDARLGNTLVQIAETDPEDSVRQQAVSALGRFVYLGELAKIPSPLMRRIESALFAILERPNEPAQVQREALQSLGYSSRAEVKPAIEAALASADAVNRRAGLVAAGRSADPHWAQPVLDRLADPEPRLREEAARAAGELELRKAVPELVDLLEDIDAAVQQAAIWSLGQVGGRRATNVLNELAESGTQPQNADLIEEALEYLAFLEGTPDLTLMEYDPEDDTDEV